MDLKPLREQDTGTWADHYEEPFSGLVYRQDRRGNWYDVEGVRLSVPVFLRGDVLISLPGKRSRRSFAFGGRQVKVSPNVQLIQIGKLVLDVGLNPVRYYGDRLAGLGEGYLSFGGTDCWQEVRLSLRHGVFINEYDRRPLRVNDEEITGYLGSDYVAGARFDTVSSAGRAYVLRGGSEGVFTIADRPARVRFSSLTAFDGDWLALCSVDPAGNEWAYADLGAGTFFHLGGHPGEPVTELSALEIPDRKLYRVKAGEHALVYDAASGSAFTIDDGARRPKDLRVHPDFPNHLLIATLEHNERVIDHSDEDTLRYGEHRFELAELTGAAGDRLLSAKSVRGESLVIDSAAGMHRLRLAMCGDRRVLRLNGAGYAVGPRILQPVLLQSMGGPIPRILVVSEPELPPLHPAEGPAGLYRPGRAFGVRGQ